MKAERGGVRFWGRRSDYGQAAGAALEQADAPACDGYAQSSANGLPLTSSRGWFRWLRISMSGSMPSA